MKVATRVHTGVAWLGSAKILGNLLSLASVLTVARILTPEDFGLVAIATTILAISNSLSELSLSTALISHARLTDEHFSSAFTLNVSRALLLAIVLAALAVPVATIYRDERLFGIMLAIAAITAFGGCASPKVVVFARAIDFKAEFLSSLSQRLFALVASVVIALATESYWALIIGTAAGQFMAVLVSYMQAPFKPRITFSKARELLSFSVWLSLSQIVVTITLRLDQLLIGYFAGRPQLGSYDMGDRLANMACREIAHPISSVLLPSFALLSNEPDRLARAYIRAQSVVSAVVIPVGFGFAAVAAPMIALVLGQKWSDAAMVVQWMAPVLALQTLGTQVGPLALSLNRPKMIFRRELMYLCFRFPVAIGGLVIWGLPGMVIGRSITGLVSTWINLALARTLLDLPIRQQLLSNRRTLVAAAAMVGLIFLLRAGGMSTVTPQQLGSVVLLAAAGYVGLLYGLWVIEKRPDGPEKDILRMVASAGQRVRRPK
jgi:lipopolysaccharide exporter